MEINSIKINGYGKLKNKNINLEKGINIIKGENESGKSTLLNYITDMFYGISKNKEGKDISDFDKYKPWRGEDFSGRIEYSLDNGKKYEIYREFKSKTPKVYNEQMEDISSQYEIDKKEGNKFFVEQTKVDKTMYLSTVVSMQEGVRLESKDQNILIQKIANIASSGDDSISYKKANEMLQNKIKNEIGNNKTLQKPINIITNRMNEIEKEIKKIEAYDDRKYLIDNEKEELIKSIEQEKEKRYILKKLESIKNEYQLEKKTLNVIENNKKENEIKLKKLNDKKNDLENKKNKILEKKDKSKKVTYSYKNVEKDFQKSKLLIFLASILVILIVTNIVTLNNNIITIVLTVLSILLLISAAVKNKKSKNNRLKNKRAEEILYQKNKEIETEENEVMNEIANIEGQINLLEENNKELTKQIEDITIRIDHDAREKCSEITNNKEITNYINDENLSKIINATDEDISKLENKLNKLEIEESIVNPQVEKLVILKEQQDFYKEKEEELKEQAETIKLSIDCLKEAYEEMKTTITPIFTKKLSESINNISNGKYSKVMINDEKGMIVENENGEYIDINRLSTGTIDELYLSLRLSMIEELSNEKMPILLDETFAYFDNKRLMSAIQYLEEKSNQHQIIIFTCSNREVEVLDKLNYSYNVIEL